MSNRLTKIINTMDSQSVERARENPDRFYNAVMNNRTFSNNNLLAYAVRYEHPNMDKLFECLAVLSPKQQYQILANAQCDYGYNVLMFAVRYNPKALDYILSVDDNSLKKLFFHPNNIFNDHLLKLAYHYQPECLPKLMETVALLPNVSVEEAADLFQTQLGKAWKKQPNTAAQQIAWEKEVIEAMNALTAFDRALQVKRDSVSTETREAVTNLQEYLQASFDSFTQSPKTATDAKELVGNWRLAMNNALKNKHLQTSRQFKDLVWLCVGLIIPVVGWAAFIIRDANQASNMKYSFFFNNQIESSNKSITKLEQSRPTSFLQRSQAQVVTPPEVIPAHTYNEETQTMNSTFINPYPTFNQ